MYSNDYHADANSYEGSAMHDSFPNGRASGIIRISDEGVKFTCEHGEITLPLNELQIKLGGASNSLVFFTHASKPDWSVYTRKKSILKHQLFTHNEYLRKQIKGVKNKRWTALAISLIILSIFFGIFFGLYLLKDPMIKTVAEQIPVSWEEKLGDAVFKQVELSSTFINDPEIKKQLDVMTQTLTKGIDDNRYAFKFHIINNSEPNAFALPGGNVVIHSGLILMADDPEEVMGVLAHEIAHVTKQHGLRNIIGSIGLFALVQAFLGDISGLGAVILDSGAYLANQKFSRDYEREADNTGWNYMIKSNVNPQGMKKFFEKIRDYKKDKVSEELDKSLNFLSTHPATEERIQNLEDKWNNLNKKDFDKINIDFKSFQDKINDNLTK